MKKFLFVILALLLVSGVANAAGIPLATDPKNTAEVWTQEVFNDAGSTLVSGDVVVWDYTDTDLSDVDLRRPYVTTTTTADDIAVAGVVVSTSCVDQSECAIAIYGPVKTKATGTVTAGTAIGTSGTARRATGYANTGNDDGVLGWSVDASTAGDSAEGGTDTMVVFVNPSVAPD